MLTRLGIKNFLVVSDAQVTFEKSFNALTGETGTGKSILFEALALALGKRLSGNMVRADAKQLEVEAWFCPPFPKGLIEVGAELGIEIEDEDLVFKRVIEQSEDSTAGRSRSYINMLQFPSRVMRQLGGYLVEFQEQHELHHFFTPNAQLQLIDQMPLVKQSYVDMQQAYSNWHRLHGELVLAKQTQEKTQSDCIWLSESIAELEELAPQPDEELQLSEKRKLLRDGQQIYAIQKDLRTYLTGDKNSDGAQSMLLRASRKLNRCEPSTYEYFSQIMLIFERIGHELDEALIALDGLEGNAVDGEMSLEDCEERLFKLRALARKYQVNPNELHLKHDGLIEDLNRLDKMSETVKIKQKELDDARVLYHQYSQTLSIQRHQQAKQVEEQIQAELPDLRLGEAVFKVALTPREEDQIPHIDGLESGAFLISTNPGQALGPIASVASGGELSRLLLALKVCFSRQNEVSTLVFDEIDAAMGGQTAAAVGRKLQALSQHMQILAVTHSPQVAASAHCQFKVEKETSTISAKSSIWQVSHQERTEEIARMLSGMHPDAQARKAAFEAARALEKEMCA